MVYTSHHQAKRNNGDGEKKEQACSICRASDQQRSDGLRDAVAKWLKLHPITITQPSLSTLCRYLCNYLQCNLSRSAFRPCPRKHTFCEQIFIPRPHSRPLVRHPMMHQQARAGDDPAWQHLLHLTCWWKTGCHGGVYESNRQQGDLACSSTRSTRERTNFAPLWIFWRWELTDSCYTYR